MDKYATFQNLARVRHASCKQDSNIINHIKTDHAGTHYQGTSRLTTHVLSFPSGLFVLVRFGLATGGGGGSSTDSRVEFSTIFGDSTTVYT